MGEINIGDIVKVDSDSSMYIVVDVIDFSEVKKGKRVEDIDCELMRILPVRKTAFTYTVNAKHLDLQAKRNTKESTDILQFVKKERELKGWFDTPDFVKSVNDNIKFEERRLDKPKKPKKEKADVIRYDKLESINQCLDALNDLDALHKTFGDESYLQLKEVVHKRLKELI